MASRQMKMPVKDDAEKSPEAASRGLGLAMAEALAEVARLIIVWLEVRVLPAPPRSLTQTEISRLVVNSPRRRLAGGPWRNVKA